MARPTPTQRQRKGQSSHDSASLSPSSQTGISAIPEDSQDSQQQNALQHYPLPFPPHAQDPVLTAAQSFGNLLNQFSRSTLVRARSLAQSRLHSHDLENLELFAGVPGKLGCAYVTAIARTDSTRYPLPDWEDVRKWAEHYLGPGTLVEGFYLSAQHGQPSYDDSDTIILEDASLQTAIEKMRKSGIKKVLLTNQPIKGIPAGPSPGPVKQEGLRATLANTSLSSGGSATPQPISDMSQTDYAWLTQPIRNTKHSVENTLIVTPIASQSISSPGSSSQDGRSITDNTRVSSHGLMVTSKKHLKPRSPTARKRTPSPSDLDEHQTRIAKRRRTEHVITLDDDPTITPGAIHKQHMEAKLALHIVAEDEDSDVKRCIVAVANAVLGAQHGGNLLMTGALHAFGTHQIFVSNLLQLRKQQFIQGKHLDWAMSLVDAADATHYVCNDIPNNPDDEDLAAFRNCKKAVFFVNVNKMHWVPATWDRKKVTVWDSLSGTLDTKTAVLCKTESVKRLFPDAEISPANSYQELECLQQTPTGNDCALFSMYHASQILSHYEPYISKHLMNISKDQLEALGWSWRNALARLMHYRVTPQDFDTPPASLHDEFYSVLERFCTEEHSSSQQTVVDIKLQKNKEDKNHILGSAFTADSESRQKKLEGQSESTFLGTEEAQAVITTKNYSEVPSAELIPKARLLIGKHMAPIPPRSSFHSIPTLLYASSSPLNLCNESRGISTSEDPFLERAKFGPPISSAPKHTQRPVTVIKREPRRKIEYVESSNSNDDLRSREEREYDVASEDEDYEYDAIEENDMDEDINKVLASSLIAKASKSLNDVLAHRMSKDIITALRVFPSLEAVRLSTSEPISLPNWTLSDTCRFFAYQLVFIAGAFVQERSELLGGILADEPGAGKTRQSLGLWVAHIHHVNNYLEVTNQWAAVKKTPNKIRCKRKHLHEDAAKDQRCPLQAELPIACWCSPRNRLEVFNNKKPTGGITLLLTPAAGMNSFVKEIKQMFHNSYFTSGQYSRPGQVKPRIAIDYGDKILAGCEPLSSAECSRVCRAPVDQKDFQRMQDAATYRSIPELGINKNSRSAANPDRKWKGTWSNTVIRHTPKPHGKSATETDVLDTAGILLITTTHSVPSKIWRKYSSTITATYNHHPAAQKLSTKGYDKAEKWQERILLLDVAKVWWDECHMGAEDMGQIYKLFRAVKSNRAQAPTIWGASGTPDAYNALQTLQFYTLLLRNHTWNNVDEAGDKAPLKNLTESHLKTWKNTTMPLILSKARKDGREAMAMAEASDLIDLHRKMQPLFMWRRTHDANWFDGNRLIPCLSKIIEITAKSEPGEWENATIERLEGDVETARKEKYREEMKSWKAGDRKEKDRPTIPSRRAVAPYHKAKSAITVPHLVVYWEKLQIGSNDSKRRFVGCDPHVGRWNDRRHLKEIYDAIEECKLMESSKWKVARRFLDKWRQEKRKNAAGRCKVIVATDLIGCMAAYSGMLRLQYGEENVVNFDASMNRKAKDAALSEFNQIKGPWIMMATLKTNGVGFNLQRANKTILLEPASKEFTLNQARARTCRLGQDEDECEFVVVHNPCSRREKADLDKLNLERGMNKKVSEAAIDGSDTSGVIHAE